MLPPNYGKATQKLYPTNNALTIQTQVKEEKTITISPRTPAHDLHTTMAQIAALVTEYTDVYDVSKGLKSMKGPPMNLNFRDDIDIKPFRATKSRAVPLHQQKEADAEIQRLIDGKVLRRATATGKWIMHGFFVAKPDKTLRLVYDCRPLNKYLTRPTHPFYHTDDILHMIPPDTKFLVSLDCRKGYWQIALSEEAQETLTMLLPSGTYSWTRAPMGCSASSDEWCRRSDHAFRGIKHVLKIVDDLLVCAPDEETAITTVRQILERCREHNITLSQKKMQIGKKAKFVGHIIEVGDDGVQIKPDPDRVAALDNFPVPKKLQDLRSFLGLAVQFSRFNPDLAHLTAPLRELGKIGVRWDWRPEHQEAFEEIKKALTSPAVLKPFNPKYKTSLFTDASRTRGMGYCLVQTTNEEPQKLRLIECGSISLSPAQENYSATEIEANAVVFAIQKCWYHLMGCSHFQVTTDHRALLSIFDRKALHDLPNVRLERMVEKVSDYNFTMEWCPGRLMKIADCLSRYPVFKAKQTPTDVDIIHSATCNTIHIAPAIDKLMTLAATDQDYQEAIKAWKNAQDVETLPTSHPARAYKKIWNEISFEHGLLTRGTRIIIPTKAKQHILDLLHLPHKGAVASHIQARNKYWWPQMKEDITRTCTSCLPCQERLPQQQQEPQLQIKATYPFEHVSVDMLTNHSKKYAALMDRYSGFLFIGQLPSEQPRHMIDFLSKCCQVPGYPAVLRSDGGPQFREEFHQWCNAHNIHHSTSDPGAPWTNGHGESAVACAQKLLDKNNGAYNRELKDSLLEWNNTPRQDGFTPSEMFNGRSTRSQLPRLPTLDNQQTDQTAAAAAREKTADAQNARKNVHSKLLPILRNGQRVTIWNQKTKRWDRFGTILSSHDEEIGRSYIIDTGGGLKLRRNRKHLRPDLAYQQNSSEEVEKNNIPDIPQQPRRSNRIAAKRKETT